VTAIFCLLSRAFTLRHCLLLLFGRHRIPLRLGLFRRHLPFVLQLLLLLGAQGVPLRNSFLRTLPGFLLNLSLGGLGGHLPWQDELVSG
jgi:hypothetical protein